MGRHEVRRLVNETDTVAEAALFAGCLVGDEKRTRGKGTLDAARDIATRHRLPPALIRALVQPSRRPKDISQRWWGRLWQAYLGHLRGKLAELETEIARVEALGGDRDHIRDLLDKTSALARRLEALLD